MFLFDRRNRIQRTARSQSLVEFSLSLILIMTLISGLLDLGRMYFVYTTVADSAGEGAIFLSVTPNCFSRLITTPDCSDPKNVQYRMRQAGGKLVELSNSNVRIDYVTTDCDYYAAANAGADMPATLTKDASKSAPFCDAAVDYTYQTGDQVYVQLTYPYPLLTPVISQMVPLYNGQNALPINVVASQTIIVK
jgi:hypothetical protein